jgi:hypothetical protein
MIKLRRDILKIAEARHNSHLDQARMALKARESDAFSDLIQLLEDNKKNASVLVGGDSTQFYIGKLKAGILLYPSRNHSGDWTNTSSKPIYSGHTGAGQTPGPANVQKPGGNQPPATESSEFGSFINGTKTRTLGITSTQNRCGTDEMDRKYVPGSSMTITPKKKIQILSATLYTTDVGRATVILSASNESRSGSFRLTDGFNPLSISDKDGLAGVVLLPGITYTLTVSLAKTSGKTPMLESSTCASSGTSSAEATIQYSGNYSVYDLKFKAE